MRAALAGFAILGYVSSIVYAWYGYDYIAITQFIAAIIVSYCLFTESY